ncbi:alpha/beta fold hydrolase [Sphingomonas mesophila]|uniref:alpha/beta fold hydrolase n=1 Tax=Sphingomonas mesophila TaxID=2303576 RepID=UPI000E591A90|nr:alpha/beta hydrolase [Sphingomonas mesophila]
MLARLIAAALAANALALPSPAAAAAKAAPGAEVAQPVRFSVVTLGKGPDVILIPGLSSRREVFAATAERLRKTHRVHLVQLRGFGEPAGANAEGPVLGPFVAELGAYAARLKRPALIGHSMGGLSAMMIAARFPDVAGRVLVIDALPFIGPLFGAASVEALRPQADMMRAMLLKNAGAAKPDFALRTDCRPGPAPAAPAGTMTNSAQGACLVAAGAKSSDLRVVASVMHEVMTTDLTPELARIRAPLTLLYPQDDRLLSAEAAARIYGDAYAPLKSARLVPVKGSRHFIMQDQPAAFAREADAFLK